LRNLNKLDITESIKKQFKTIDTPVPIILDIKVRKELTDLLKTIEFIEKYELKPLLTDLSIFPTNEVLIKILKDSYPVFINLSEILINEMGLKIDWVYPKDKQYWICNVKKKKE